MDCLARIGPEWELLPLRVPGGWTVHVNGLIARRRPDGRVEADDSEDLLWIERQPPPGRERPSHGPSRELHIDAGWYHDHFCVAVLDPDWDHVAATFTTTELGEVIACVEKWLVGAPDGDLTPP